MNLKEEFTVTPVSNGLIVTMGRRDDYNRLQTNDNAKVFNNLEDFFDWVRAGNGEGSRPAVVDAVDLKDKS